MTRMSTNQRWILAVVSVVLCVAAVRFGVAGRDPQTGNRGFLGTELAGVAGESGQNSYVGVLGEHTSGSVGSLGTISSGVAGQGDPSGVDGFGTLYGVLGRARHDTFGTYGVFGEAYTGVFGRGNAIGTGVDGYSNGGYGVRGRSLAGTGVYGVLDDGGTGHAGYFLGRVHVQGSLSKSIGSFKIDHPLDPANKYLYHSFVESPDMMNIYNGIATLDERGRAVVELPGYFEALNRDFRYQLTCIGASAPVYVGRKIEDNAFTIAGGYEGLEVSWEVTGIRKDPYAEANRIQVEVVKSPDEIGRLLHPEVYGQPPSMRIKAAPRRPETKER